jgi:Kef-type K+ transport system membrane component KefB
MFLVGLELNADRLRGRARAVVAIAHAGIAAAFLLGVILAVVLHGRYSPEGVSPPTFAVFFGVSMAVTAFPVLARILADRGESRTELGVIALGCAATGDVAAWCLLAIAAGMAQARAEAALLTIALAGIYVSLMVFVARPFVARAVRRYESEPLTPARAAWVFVAVLASALVTEWIGIHAVFGAFLLGVLIPHDSALARELGRRLEDVSTSLLLPAFFAITGMRTEIGLLATSGDWFVCLVIVVAASFGKIGGSYVAARIAGLERRAAAELGVLMNTRGLMELIVLNIGLDLGVLSPVLFAMLVLMALVTTVATAPLLGWLRPATIVAAHPPG